MAEGRVPVPAGVFVGREAQLEDLTTSVGTERLTVLTGPPGVGKTRLAREVSARVAGAFPEGTCFVELAAAGDRTEVPVAVARALAVWEQPGRPVVDSIVARLSTRRSLLVLDNCEHILKGCAALAATLLDACPGLTILATSQETLGVRGERVWPVLPLAIPGAGAGPEQLWGSDAVALFCARAVAAAPSFAPSDSGLEVIAEICRRLDGIPLAIELAAAQMTFLTLPDLAKRLDRRFALLTTHGRVTTSRHETLRTALDWSYGLLSEPERALLRALSVFPAGCTSGAAAAVSGSTQHRRIRERLARLAARSLVIVEPGVRPRYRMLAIIRLFATECLNESGEAATVRARQAAWCMALMEKAEPGLTRRDQIRWLGRLDAEHANVSSALAWAEAEGEAEIALRLAGAMTIFWRVRGYFHEGLQSLTAALDIAAEQQPPGLRAKALWGVGLMTIMLGDTPRCHRVSIESLRLAGLAGDRSGQARALLVLGNRAAVVSEHVEALNLLRDSAVLARAAGDGWCRAHALGMSGFVHLDAGDLTRARAALTGSLREARRHRDRQSLRLGLLLMGALCAENGEAGRAEAVLSEGLEIARALREPYAIAVAEAQMGRLAVSRGDYARGRDRLESALAIDSELGTANSVAATRMDLANLARDQGDHSRAHRGYTDLVGTGQHVAAVLGLGELALSRGELEKASRLLEEARVAGKRRGDARRLAAATAGLARLARVRGDFTPMVSLQVEALSILRGLRDTVRTAQVLEDMAGAAAELGAPERAARLFGAASALRARGGFPRTPVERSGFEADVARVRAALGRERLEARWKDGAAMPPGAALTYASRWKGARGRSRETGGWSGLTAAERRIASLVASGMTNGEVATRLGIATRTVGAHLNRVFAALEITSRRDLLRPPPGTQQWPHQYAN